MPEPDHVGAAEYGELRGERGREREKEEEEGEKEREEEEESERVRGGGLQRIQVKKKRQEIAKKNGAYGQKKYARKMQHIKKYKTMEEYEKRPILFY